MNSKLKDRFATSILYVIAGIICALLLGIIGYVLVLGVPQISWNFLTAPSESFSAGGGIGPQLFNSFYLLFLTLCISVPISLGAAIYLSEYAKNNWITKSVRLMVEVLSSLPSIVVGLFGFLIFVIYFGWSFSILSGALALTLFNLPILVRVMEESLKSVASTQREAGLALGLTRWETVIYVLVPTALPGIITGIILSAGRVFGEAAALIYTAGQNAPALNFANFNIFSQESPWNIMRPAETLAVHIWKVNSEGVVPDATAISNGTAAILIIAILLFNVLARVIGKYVYRLMTSS
ncbi:phosphate ABC transporter permease PstA [Brochothrix thermosphacta]|uniref:Phosphate transport system permease protein PstA n=1 Tax=Brochothrix thermosphacta TaxID=2756 RepID=A0A1D2KWS1_BROTH|nr:phosphate ABC transporter permease PstA [Brochothrix thermosphacta]ATF26179.1 phosphate ABC transporter, permease protein PstA [Brochothrix thermosphacta]ATH85518.1 phosphate ABC transporter, permease protein PstA [Brochothrix thermosphacta]MPQ29106.1 phosphate ABC transporter permease PstA [Brochothrix thermosphacta]ODJ62125.1 phosphate ABC transporter, permease protein PstA [Brochothrix thermosphacta]ODJ68904.1 phosphate ABC transporter, permease protein PstA [Brochothrix thermosphacta]